MTDGREPGDPDSSPAAQAPARPWRASAVTLALAVVGGIAAGVAIWIVSEWLSRSDIGGRGWSLRGNGALIVPFVLGAALLGGGWTALFLWHRRRPGWAARGLGAAVAAGVVALVGGMAPVLLVARGPGAPPPLPPALVNAAPLIIFLVAIFGPLLVAAMTDRGASSRLAWRWLALSALLLPLSAMLGLLGSQRAVTARASSTVGPRMAHEALLLATGEVLVAGGAGPYGPMVSTEVYDPPTGTWLPTGTLPSGPVGYDVAMLGDGKAIAASGSDRDGRARAAVYDAAQRAWTEIHAPPGVVGLPRLVALETGAVLAVATSAGNAPPVMERYEPRTDEWTISANPLTVRLVADAVRLPDARVLVVGMGAPRAAAAEIYDPAQDTWSNVPAPPVLPSPIGGSLLALSDGRVLLIGGGPEGGGGVALYDAGSNSWSGAPDMEPRRFDPAATVLRDGRVLVSGGNAVLGAGPRVEPTANAELFDPATKSWSPTGSMGAPRAGHTLTTLGDGRVLAAGGRDGSGELSSAELYDPSTGAWTPTASMDGR